MREYGERGNSIGEGLSMTKEICTQALQKNRPSAREYSPPSHLKGERGMLPMLS